MDIPSRHLKSRYPGILQEIWLQQITHAHIRIVITGTFLVSAIKLTIQR